MIVADNFGIYAAVDKTESASERDSINLNFHHHNISGETSQRGTLKSEFLRLIL